MTSGGSISETIEGKSAFRLLGIVASIVGAAIGIIAMRERRPEVSVVILNESNVFDVHEPVAALDVVYNGVSLNRNKLNLKLISIRLQNTGNVDILPSQYDDRIPWGFRVLDGSIVDTRLVNASSSYLRENLQPRHASDGLVLLNKIILDRGTYATIDVLLLHAKNREPRIVPEGKIAGVAAIRVSRATTSERQGALAQVFAGSLLVQIARFGAYGIVYLLAFTLTWLLTIEFAKSTLQRRRVRKKRRQIRRVLLSRHVEKRYWIPILDAHEYDGTRALTRLRDLLDNEDDLQKFLSTMTNERRRRGEANAKAAESAPSTKPVALNGPDVVLFLQRNGIVHRDETGAAHVEPGFVAALSLVLADVVP